ncbi:MAG: thioesterase family protein [Pseudomonadota bacterium]
MSHALNDKRVTQPAAFFVPHGAAFEATELTRGPWHPDFQHAGPPSALLARSLEQLAGDTFSLSRVTVEILKPIPIARLVTSASALRAGRKVQWLRAELKSVDGTTLAHASAVAIRKAEVPVPTPTAAARECPPGPEASKPFGFPFFSTDVGYHTGMELRIAQGEWGSGAIAMWMRMRQPLVLGEAPTPLQRVMTAADSGNGVSLCLDLRHYSFVNPDLTVYLHRAPVGEWVCLDARTIPQGGGRGITDTRLLDEQGEIGRSNQSLIIEARGA